MVGAVLCKPYSEQQQYSEFWELRAVESKEEQLLSC